MRAKKKKKATAASGRSAGDRPRREEILRAATKEFSAKGFHGATTAGIARVAGVAQPLVHHHFGSKVGLWEAVLTDLFDELRTLQEGTVRDLHGVDLAASLKIFLRQFVLFSARRPELARIMVQEGAATKGFDGSLEGHVRPQLERFEVLLQQLVGQYRVPMSKREVQLLCFLAIGAST
ncbi:MAG TPA: TetR/AcrR family transcriptional regulator, partial [Polyangiaceae bacterium]